jgi:predicted  nucleic acid-binding Zn-ribbon protein
MITKDDMDEYWDSMSHTSSEYREEIRSLRSRIAEYLREIDALKTEKHSIAVDWIKAQDEIQMLREQIASLLRR